MDLLNSESLHLVLLVFQVVVAASLIGFILIQHGKGADAGAAFGSGASSTVFGSQGSGNFLTKTTAVLAFLFLSNSLLLGYMATQRVEAPVSLMESEAVVIEEVMETDVPAMNTPESDIPSIPED
ncbi:MAG: preprotein translocase subunit SecG [Gammaproteobacteria bacterium]|nr:preprotein translocase subunit SecG [Gammaproteobacteria bacterium]